AVDPLVTLAPDGPNTRTDGNVWTRIPLPPPPKPAGQPSGGPTGPTTQPGIKPLKWTAGDFAELPDGRMPIGEAIDDTLKWEYGEVEAGFKNAALILDETFTTPPTANLPLESRTAMAYWQNGKLYLHGSTQSTIQTIPALARWVGIDPNQVVVI